MKYSVEKKDLFYWGGIFKNNPHILNMRDTQHSTGNFLSNILGIKHSNLRVGVVSFEEGFNKILETSAKGLCIGGHPVTLAKHGGGVLVNAFTTVRPGIVRSPNVVVVSKFGFNGKSITQGYNKNSVLIPNAGIKSFKDLNLPVDLSKDQLLKILFEHIRTHGEDAVLVDLIKIITKESTKHD